MPDADTLAGYEAQYAGAAKLLIDEHVADRQHARDMQRRETDNERLGVMRGQAASFVLMGGAIGGSVICAMYDHSSVAVVLGSAPVLTALSRFLGKNRATDQRKEKDADQSAID